MERLRQSLEGKEKWISISAIDIIAPFSPSKSVSLKIGDVFDDRFEITQLYIKAITHEDDTEDMFSYDYRITVRDIRSDITYTIENTHDPMQEESWIEPMEDSGIPPELSDLRSNALTATIPRNTKN